MSDFGSSSSFNNDESTDHRLGFSWVEDQSLFEDLVYSAYFNDDFRFPSQGEGSEERFKDGENGLMTSSCLQLSGTDDQGLGSGKCADQTTGLATKNLFASQDCEISKAMDCENGQKVQARLMDPTGSGNGDGLTRRGIAKEWKNIAVGLSSASENMSEAARRTNRAAEVHNLSERKRRSRINEKIRALQELIPRCDKSDIVSVLDATIKYLEWLQMQVKSMTQAQMGQGLSSNPSGFYQPFVATQPQVPSQAAISSPVDPVLNNQLRYQNQIQNSHLLQEYARFLNFSLMQTQAASFQSIHQMSNPGAASTSRSSGCTFAGRASDIDDVVSNTSKKSP